MKAEGHSLKRLRTWCKSLNGKKRALHAEDGRFIINTVWWFSDTRDTMLCLGRDWQYMSMETKATRTNSDDKLKSPMLHKKIAVLGEYSALLTHSLWQVKMQIFKLCLYGVVGDFSQCLLKYDCIGSWKYRLNIWIYEMN